MAKSDEQLNKQDARRSRNTTAGGKADTRDNYRFVNIELTSSQKEEFKALLADGEFDDVSLDAWLLAGYKVTFSSGDGGKTVVCSVICGVVGDANYGYILTGRGGDSTTALRVAAYKDTYLCENGEWLTSPNLTAKSTGDIG